MKGFDPLILLFHLHYLHIDFVSPLAVNMNNVFEADSKYMTCIKAGLLAHVAGYAPAVSIEFARKVLMSKDRPSFFAPFPMLSLIAFFIGVDFEKKPHY